MGTVVPKRGHDITHELRAAARRHCLAGSQLVAATSLPSWPGVELFEQRLWSDGPVGVLAQGLDLTPIDATVQTEPDPAATAYIGRLEKLATPAGDQSR